MIGMFNGYRVVVTPYATQPKVWVLPVFALRPWINVSDSFRAETDQWLADLFGGRTEEVIHGCEPGAIISETENLLFVHPVVAKAIEEVHTKEP